MFNGEDMQIFLKMLDVLSTSLRDIVVKHELLLAASDRLSKDKEKTDTIIRDIEQEISSFFPSLNKDFEKLKIFATEVRDNDVKFTSLIYSLIKNIDGLTAQLTTAIHSLDNMEACTKDNKSIVVHIDDHMDKFGNQLTALQSSASDIAKMLNAVENMQQQMEPFKRLTSLISKPVAILVAIYVIFVTIVAIMDGCKRVDVLKQKFTYPTNVVVQTTSIPR